jgi:hypothetical protein
MKSKICIIALFLSLLISACSSNTVTTDKFASANTSTDISGTTETADASSSVSTATATESTYTGADTESASSTATNQAAPSSKVSPGTSTKNSNKPIAKKPSTTESGTDKSVKKPADNSPMMDKPDLMGEVTSVSGNKIVLKLIETPAFDKGSRPEKPSGDKPAEVPGNSTGGVKPETQPGNQPPQRTVKYTGETKTITVSDSVPITTTVMADKKIEQKTLALKDIKSGDTLSIWYSDKTKGTIKKISVMEGSVRNTAN